MPSPMPYEKQQEMLWELGQIDIGLGTLVATNERITQAIDPSITELSNWLKQTQPNIHVDETPWSVKGVKEWLWVIANSEFCLFTAADTRSRAELEAILGTQYNYLNILVSSVLMTIVFTMAIKLLPNKNVWLIYAVISKN